MTGMSAERPICYYFLLNQHKAASSQCSILAWIETTCGGGWRKVLVQHEPEENAARFPCKFSSLRVRRIWLLEHEYEASGITVICSLNMNEDKRCALRLLFSNHCRLTEMFEGGLLRVIITSWKWMYYNERCCRTCFQFGNPSPSQNVLVFGIIAVALCNKGNEV